MCGLEACRSVAELAVEGEPAVADARQCCSVVTDHQRTINFDSSGCQVLIRN